MRIRKLVLDLSLAQILPEKINKMFSLNNLGFIDMSRTVYFDNFLLSFENIWLNSDFKISVTTHTGSRNLNDISLNLKFKPTYD